MKKYLFLIPTLSLLISCGSNQESKKETVELPADINLADTIFNAKKVFTETDILSVERPNMSIEEAYEIQYELLEKYTAQGAVVEGYKMGGTVSPDSAGFKPIHAYMLNTNRIEKDSTVNIKNFPGGKTMVEAEIGFILGKDLPNGTSSIEEVLEAVENVVGAIEFAQPITIPPTDNPEGMTTNHIIAAGVGHSGFIVGDVKADPASFDFSNETVKCYVNDSLVVEGSSSVIFGTPANALYHLSNLLLKRGTYLKKGDVVITGSTLKNPTINGQADVRMEFSTLGTITFSSK